MYASLVWTKRGVGHGLPCGLPYDLPVVKLKKKKNIARTAANLTMLAQKEQKNAQRALPQIFQH